MRKIVEKKGITLIALVITIIVLLILAGITINLTVGQDGIMNMAQKAGKNYIDAQIKEEQDIARITNEIKISSSREVVENFTGEFWLSAYAQENNSANESYFDINTSNYKNLQITVNSILPWSSYAGYYECKVYGDNTEIMTINSNTSYELDVSNYSKIRIYYKENTGWYHVKGSYTLSN